MSHPGSEEWLREKEQASEVNDLFGIGLGAAKAINILGGFRPGDKWSTTMPADSGGRITIDPSHPLNTDDLFHPSLSPGSGFPPAPGFDPTRLPQNFEGRPQTHFLSPGDYNPLTGPLHNVEGVGSKGWKPEYIDLGGDPTDWEIPAVDDPVHGRPGMDFPPQDLGWAQNWQDALDNRPPDPMEPLDPADWWQGLTSDRYRSGGEGERLNAMWDNLQQGNWHPPLNYGGPPDKNHPRINPPFYTPDTQLPGPPNSAPWRLSPPGWFENWLQSREWMDPNRVSDGPHRGFINSLHPDTVAALGGGAPPQLPGDGGGGGNDPWPTLPRKIEAGQIEGDATGGEGLTTVDRSQMGAPEDAAFALGAKAVLAGAPNNPADPNFEPLVLHAQNPDGSLRSPDAANVAGPGPTAVLDTRQDAYTELKNKIAEGARTLEAGGGSGAIKAYRGQLEAKFADEMWFRVQSGQDFWEVYTDIYHRSPQADGNRVARMIHPDELRKVITAVNAQGGDIKNLGKFLNTEQGGIFNNYLRRVGFYGPLDAGTNPNDWTSQPSENYKVNPDGTVTFKNPGTPGATWPGAGSLGYSGHEGGTSLAASSNPSMAGYPYWSHGTLNPSQGGLSGTSQALYNKATIPQNIVDIGKLGAAEGKGAMDKLFRSNFGLAPETSITRGRMFGGIPSPEIALDLAKRGLLGAKEFAKSLNPPKAWDITEKHPGESWAQYRKRTLPPEELTDSQLADRQKAMIEDKKLKEYRNSALKRLHPDRIVGGIRTQAQIAELADVNEANRRYRSYRDAPFNERITAAEAIANPRGDHYKPKPKPTLADQISGKMSPIDRLFFKHGKGRVPNLPVGTDPLATTALTTTTPRPYSSKGAPSVLPGEAGFNPNPLGDAFGGGGPTEASKGPGAKVLRGASQLTNPRIPGVGGAATGFFLTAAAFESAMSGAEELSKGTGEMQALGATTTGQIHRDMYHHAKQAGNGSEDSFYQLGRIFMQAGMPKDAMVEAVNGTVAAARAGEDPVKYFNENHNTDPELANRSPLLKILHHFPLVGNFTGMDAEGEGGQRGHGFGNVFNDPNNYLRNAEQSGLQSAVTLASKPITDVFSMAMGMDPEDPLAMAQGGGGFGQEYYFGKGPGEHLQRKKEAGAERFADYAENAYASGNQDAIDQVGRLLSNYRGVQFQGDDFLMEDDKGNKSPSGFQKGKFLAYLLSIGATPGSTPVGEFAQVYEERKREKERRGWRVSAVGDSGESLPIGEGTFEWLRKRGSGALQVDAQGQSNIRRAPRSGFWEFVGDINNELNPFASRNRSNSIFPSDMSDFKKNFETHSSQIAYNDPQRSFGGFSTQSGNPVTGSEGLQLAQDVARRRKWEAQGTIEVPNLQYDTDGDNKLSDEELEWAAQQGNPFGTPSQTFNVGGAGSAIRQPPSDAGTVVDYDEEATPEHSLFDIERYVAENAARRGARAGGGDGWTPEKSKFWDELVSRRARGHDYVQDPQTGKWGWTAERQEERMKTVTNEMLTKFGREEALDAGLHFVNGKLVPIPREKSLWEKNRELRERIERPDPSSETYKNMNWFLRTFGRSSPSKF